MSKTTRKQRAQAVAEAGSLAAALMNGTIDRMQNLTLSEALVLGLLRQGVSKYFAIFGHGSTDLAEVLRVYEEFGVTRTINCRNEVEMAHAATALAWQYGETCAVVTSIGPGALQAMAGSLASASNGVGVYHVYGDETTRGEGYNMQQIPKPEQGLFGRLTALMGHSFTLHTPEALRECMRRGTATVHHPYKAGPFYVLLPLNTQPQRAAFNLETLPTRLSVPAMRPANDEPYDQAIAQIAKARRITIKAGGGCRGHDAVLTELAERIGGAVVLSPGSTGVLPDAHPQNMHVGGSKGSISGNFAMENADLLIAIGTRGVCQSDCSGIGYPNAKAVININGDLDDLSHYANTIALPGEIGATTSALLDRAARSKLIDPAQRMDWLSLCRAKKAEWQAFKAERFACPPLVDAVWRRPVLTQPAAILVAARLANEIGAVKYFDAGDVQANGFQIVEDERSGQTYTETGSSYMGFAVSALLAPAVAEIPAYGMAFTGDGSFMMNPQILMDAVQHGVKGCIILFDNRRMAAITGLQKAQYGKEFATRDGVAVDYVQVANAIVGVNALHGGETADDLANVLRSAVAFDGLSFVHVPVYWGDDPRGGMGSYGAWNVGNWVEDVQARYLEQRI